MLFVSLMNVVVTSDSRMLGVFLTNSFSYHKSSHLSQVTLTPS